MYREFLEGGAYDSASEYDQLLAFARDEFEEEVAEEIAMEEFERSAEREDL